MQVSEGLGGSDEDLDEPESKQRSTVYSEKFPEKKRGAMSGCVSDVSLLVELSQTEE
jgi:hypothetical protein